MFWTNTSYRANDKHCILPHMSVCSLQLYHQDKSSIVPVSSSDNDESCSCSWFFKMITVISKVCKKSLFLSLILNKSNTNSLGWRLSQPTLPEALVFKQVSVLEELGLRLKNKLLSQIGPFRKVARSLAILNALQQAGWVLSPLPLHPSVWFERWLLS